jgi:DNA-binding Lrp family transcriptional regulator
MMPALLDSLDSVLLNAIQEQVPLLRRPYAQIAKSLDVTEADVIDRLRELHDGPRSPIRQIGAIFDSKSLGYQSTLVAARVNEAQLPAAVEAINAHPGVSHNYRREHAYNLWFTLAVAPDSRLGLEKTAEVLRQRSGASAMRLMPTLKLYKIGVKLNLTGGGGGRSNAVTSTTAPVTITDEDKRLIRVLQQDLPIVEEPFDIWAKQADASVDRLLDAAAEFQNRKIMRRFSAVLRHRELGFDANAMGVWVVPPVVQDKFGETAARFPEVSHCYLRPSYEDWPYNIFTMIHTQDRAAATTVLKTISAATGIDRYTALYSTQEYKKVRVRYFTDEAMAWEAGV